MSRRALRAMMVAVGVLVLPASASAATSQFITAKRGTDGPLAVRGASGTEGAPTLDLPPFAVSCAAARATGDPSPGYTELRNDVKFSHCATTVSAGGQSVTIPARVKGAMDLFYRGDGDAELVNPFEVVLPTLKCTIAIAEAAQLHNDYRSATGVGGGVGPIAVPYQNLSVPTRDLRDFPSGYQQRLQIDNRQVGLLYSFSGGCANLEPGVGQYSGTIVEEARGGNLEFLPGSEWSVVENKEGGTEPFEEGWNLEKVGGS